MQIGERDMWKFFLPYIKASSLPHLIMEPDKSRDILRIVYLT